MKRKIESIKGLFGQIIHYKDGVKIGESWPGLLDGSQNHYDADGRYVGYSDRGIFAEQVHHDEHGNYIVETHSGVFGQKKHYSIEHGYIGETWDGFAGDRTDISDEVGFFSIQEPDASFDDGEW